MTRGEAISIIQGRIGQRSNTDLTNQIIAELKLVQTDLEREPTLPWFLIKTLTENESTATFATETDFIREVQDVTGLSIMVDGVRKPLVKDDYDFLSRQSNLEGTGQPKFYALVGFTYYLFPTPDKAYSFTKVYYAEDATLATDIENKWLKHIPGLLIAMAGRRVSLWLRDPNAVSLFESEIPIYRDQLMKANAAFDAAAQEAYMGG